MYNERVESPELYIYQILVVNPRKFAIIYAGQLLVTENQRAIINNVVEVKAGVYSHKTQTKQLRAAQNTPGKNDRRKEYR